jgi:hypothetical protein
MSNFNTPEKLIKRFKHDFNPKTVASRLNLSRIPKIIKYNKNSFGNFKKIANLKQIQKNGYDCLIIPRDTIVYKWIPEQYSNKFQNKMGFYSINRVAQKYAQKYANKEGQVYKFRFKNDCILLNLNSYDNLRNIVLKQLEKIYRQGDLKKAEDEIFKLYIICATTGFMMDWDTQKKIIRWVNPKGEGGIIIDGAEDEFNYKIEVNGTVYSGEYKDLNRASFGTYFDEILLGWICENTGLNGYINGYAPSLLEYKRYGDTGNEYPMLDPEIGLCKQKMVRKL